jgi:hypothetical protein
MLAPAVKVSYAKVHIIADHAIEQFSGSMGLVTLPRIELNGLIDEPKKRRTELMGFHITKALNAPSKKEFLNPLIVKEVTGAKMKFRKDINCGKANEEAQMYWPSTAKLSRRAELRAVDREVADLPTRLLSAEESVKLDYMIDKQFNVMTYIS